MKRSLKWLGLSCGLTGLGAFVTGISFAGGIPESEALTYSGRLESPDGEPLTGERNIEVKLWDASEGGSSLCSSNSQSVELEQGRFTVSLHDSCTAAVGEHAETWVEVLVNGSSLGRAKTGAVPYAVEANHAKSADALGTLKPDDLAFVGGDGINVNETTIGVDSGYVQRRVQACTNGVIRSINENGSVACASPIMNLGGDVTATINSSGVATLDLAANSVGSVEIGNNAIGRSELDGTELVVYQEAAGCGGGLTTSTTCNTIACGGEAVSGSGLTRFRQCSGTCDNLPTPVSCSGLQQAGYLLASGMKN